MRIRTVLFASGVIIMALAGCASTDEVTSLEIRATPPAAEAPAKPSDGLRVAVASFEDARPDPKGLGTRFHLLGGKSYFDVSGGKPAAAVAPLLAEYLKEKGWHAQVVKPGDVSTAGNSDVMLTGKLLDMSVNATSRIFSTKITATTKLAIQARNTGDDSVVRTTLSGEGSQSVFWYDSEDAERLLNDVLSDSLEKLLTGTKVENNLLRLK